MSQYTCSQCRESKPRSEFNRHVYGKRRRCRDCREANAAEVGALKEQGKKVCSLCKTAKPFDEFSPHSKTRPILSNRCMECARQEQYERRRARGVPERRSRASIGTEEAGFRCITCDEVKPSTEFRRKKDGEAGKWEYRCRRCNSIRNRATQRTLKGQFRSGRNVAKQRGIEWALTFEEFAALRTKPCAYCGFPLAQTSTGLDRINSAVGYTVDNVLPSCWECNQAKNIFFTVGEMKRIGAVIGAIKAERQARGEPTEQRVAKGDGSGRGWGRPRLHADL